MRITYRGFDDREHTADLVPLAQKPAMRILHTINIHAAPIIASLMSDASGLAGALRALDFDLFWDVAEQLLRAAIIDGHEVKKLEDFEPLKGHIEDLYVLVLEGLKANYPDFFTKIQSVLKLERIVPTASVSNAQST